MAEGPAVSICVLFYGDTPQHYQLARRVLNAPMQALGTCPDVEFRFGCNACGAQTTAFVEEQARKFFPASQTIASAENTYKYPMMRQMFAAAPLPETVIWFDHDSYLTPSIDPVVWLARVRRQAAACAVLGSVYRGLLSPEQRDWVAAQPWCATPPAYGCTPYAAGSWWAASGAVLDEHNWPPPDLQQKGGDILFGELLRQRGLSLCHFRDGVCVNTNSAGVEGAKPRTIV
jgi:hypothetical protein